MLDRGIQTYAAATWVSPVVVAAFAAIATSAIFETFTLAVVLQTQHSNLKLQTQSSVINSFSGSHSMK